MIKAITHHDQWICPDEYISMEGIARARHDFMRHFGEPKTLALVVAAWRQLASITQQDFPQAFIANPATVYGLKIERDPDLGADEWRVGRSHEVVYSLEEMAS